MEHSTHSDYEAGDVVILNGWGVGESHWGGLAQKARVNGDWLVPLRGRFTPQQAISMFFRPGTPAPCLPPWPRGGSASELILPLPPHGMAGALPELSALPDTQSECRCFMKR